MAWLVFWEHCEPKCDCQTLPRVIGGKDNDVHIEYSAAAQGVEQGECQSGITQGDDFQELADSLRKSIMSRLAKKPIPIPDDVEVTAGGGTITVTGPHGTLSRAFHPSVELVLEEKAIRVSPQSGADAGAHLGTSVAHIRNLLHGAREPFIKKLIVEGIGFKAEVKGQDIALSLGFSHPVKVKIPPNLKVTSEKGVLTISGVDIEAVGQFAARLRALKKPEPYKGKGIRYEGEVIRRKQGKKTV